MLQGYTEVAGKAANVMVANPMVSPVTAVVLSTRRTRRSPQQTCDECRRQPAGAGGD